MAHQLITQFGYSKKYGLVAYKSNNSPSGAPSQEVLQEMKDLLDEEYARTKKMLLDNKDKLDKLVNALMENETLDKEEFLKIVK